MRRCSGRRRSDSSGTLVRVTHSPRPACDARNRTGGPVSKLYRESKLVMVKGPSPDPCPSLDVERAKNNKGVGKWVPEVKHTLLAKYIDAAHAAAAKDGWAGWVLIDPF